MILLVCGILERIELQDEWPKEKPMNDSELLNWLQDQIVNTIYLDDNRIIDVCGGNLRKAIADRARASADPKPIPRDFSEWFGPCMQHGRMNCFDCNEGGRDA